MSLDLVRIDETIVEHAPPPPRQRPHSQLIAAAIFSAAAIMVMATLIGLYLSARATAIGANAEWIPTDGLPLTGPNTALFTLLLGIPAMLWAQQAIRNDDRPSLWVSYGIVLLLGVAFINAQSFVLKSLNLSTDPEVGIGIADNTTALLIFTIVGVHMVIVGASMLSVLITGFRALGGRLDRRDVDSVDAVALFWYVSIALFAVLWYAVYVIK